MILQHITDNPRSVRFRKVRYYEHRTMVKGRRVLIAQAICGWISIDTDEHIGYRRFLSWIFLDSASGRYNSDKYLVAIDEPAQSAHSLYARYHSVICENSEDGASLEASIDVAKYQ